MNYKPYSENISRRARWKRSRLTFARLKAK